MLLSFSDSSFHLPTNKAGTISLTFSAFAHSGIFLLNSSCRLRMVIFLADSLEYFSASSFLMPDFTNASMNDSREICGKTIFLLQLVDESAPNGVKNVWTFFTALLNIPISSILGIRIIGFLKTENLLKVSILSMMILLAKKSSSLLGSFLKHDIINASASSLEAA